MSDRIEGLRSTLRALHEQEGEVLREAARLRVVGAPADEIAAAESEAEKLQARMNATASEIERLQLH